MHCWLNWDNVRKVDVTKDMPPYVSLCSACFARWLIMWERIFLHTMIIELWQWRNMWGSTIC